MAKKGYGDCIGSGRSVNTTSINQGNGSYKAQGRPAPEAGVTRVSTGAMRLPTTKPAVKEGRKMGHGEPTRF